VADTHRGVIWEHAWKYARNLFWRISFPKQLLNLRPQKAVGSQARRVATAAAPQRSTLMSKNRAVTPPPKRVDQPERVGILGYTTRYEQALDSPSWGFDPSFEQLP